MPTAARAVAAFIMALMGAAAAHYILPLVHDDTIIPYFPCFSGFLGAVTGWISVGRRIDQRKYGSLSAGLTGSALFAFWFVFFQVSYRVLQFALRGRFRRNGDAFDEFVGWFIEYSALLLTFEMLGVLLSGGIVAGAVANIASKYWK